MTSYPCLLAAHSRALDGLRRYLADEHDVVDERDLTWLSGPLAAAPSTRVAFTRRGGDARVGHVLVETSPDGSLVEVPEEPYPLGRALPTDSRTLPLEGVLTERVLALHALASEHEDLLHALESEVRRRYGVAPHLSSARTLAWWASRRVAGEVAVVEDALAALVDGAPVEWVARRVSRRER